MHNLHRLSPSLNHRASNQPLRGLGESGRDGSATAIVAAFELLALSMAIAPETSGTTAIKIAIIFIRFLS
jgi:hypothetical protein